MTIPAGVPHDELRVGHIYDASFFRCSSNPFPDFLIKGLVLIRRSENGCLCFIYPIYGCHDTSLGNDVRKFYKSFKVSDDNCSLPCRVIENISYNNIVALGKFRLWTQCNSPTKFNITFRPKSKRSKIYRTLKALVCDELELLSSEAFINPSAPPPHSCRECNLELPDKTVTFYDFYRRSP